MSQLAAQQAPKKINKKAPAPQPQVTPPVESFLNISTLDALRLQRTPSCACGGSCPFCTSSLPIQPKLKIGAPNDKYEQEADRVADQIMRMPEPGLQRKPT